MSTARAGIQGQVPRLLIRPTNETDPEVAKYQKMWSNPDYRAYSPGEQAFNALLQLASPRRGDTCIDFGCGTGRGALMLALMGGLNVTMLDFADNCLDDDIYAMLSTQSQSLRFYQQDLRNPIPYRAKYGYCTDVMEHVHPDFVDTVLDNILKSAEHVLFQISVVPDEFGAVNGEPLHLTVQPMDWWKAKLKEHDAVIHFAAGNDLACMFYVTAWNDASEIVKRGVVNTNQVIMGEHIKGALARGLQTCVPSQIQNLPIMLLGGGPSLNDFEDEIRAKRNQGVPLVTTNGAYNWCIERGIKPSAQIIVDAREHNARFVQPVVEGCKYLISSQCHPKVFDAVPAHQTWLWHAAISDELCDILDQHYWSKGQAWYPVPGGSTVMLRAFPLLRMLGFWKFDVYGFDSCLQGESHHAYQQPENEYEKVVSVTCGGKVFPCHVWMASQAQEFIDMVALMQDDVQIEIHGDGLIRHILETGAQLEDES